ncbi:MAG: four helix bundle protein [Candidatus Omnitrophica bacterium]|nr:four helix bundle protein [Candidatus Omnitrophota bacterium]
MSQVREETIGLWNDSVKLFNEISAATCHFPADDKFGLKYAVTDTSKNLMDKIASSSYSQSQNTYEERLKYAAELLHKTMGQLYIATEKKYLSKGYYEQLFNNGRSLVEKICLLAGISYKTFGLN